VTTVLICDDSMFARTLTRKALEQAGHEVVGEAQDGIEAIEKYGALKPGLLMVDLVMPRLGGTEAIRRIVAEHPDARIVACSAMGQEQMIKEAIDAGASAYVMKPARPEALVAAVTDALL
jgi:two-component system chemotaxis response regulator CheY